MSIQWVIKEICLNDKELNMSKTGLSKLLPFWPKNDCKWLQTGPLPLKVQLYTGLKKFIYSIFCIKWNTFLHICYKKDTFWILNVLRLQYYTTSSYIVAIKAGGGEQEGGCNWCTDLNLHPLHWGFQKLLPKKRYII